MRKKILVSWSTGKDSAWTLHELQQDPQYEVAGLFCTVDKDSERTAVHAVRLELLRQQASSIGIPLDIVEISYPCSNDDYETAMKNYLAGATERGVKYVAFGDLYLEDIRDYRINLLKGTGLSAEFPLWDRPTDSLSRQMIRGGLKAVITCVNTRRLDASFAGREFNAALLADLPPGVDPCGENGEFHSFVFDGPMFRESISYEIVHGRQTGGFAYADIKPAARIRNPVEPVDA